MAKQFLHRAKRGETVFTSIDFILFGTYSIYATFLDLMQVPRSTL